MDISEKIIEFIANKVKGQRFYVINNIPERLSGEYRRISKEQARISNDVFNFNRHY